MDDKICICFLTHKRTDVAVRTIQGIKDNLLHENRVWYIAADGSLEDHVAAIHDALKGETIVGQHTNRLHPGPSWNKAVEEGLKHADILMWLECDWILPEPLDIGPYVRLLNDHTDVGMVRLGGMAVGSDLHSVGYDGIHYLKYLRTSQYAYSGNPSLRHRRYFDAYAGYPNDERNPGECEVAQDDRFRTNDGPDIVWPISVGGWGIFWHQGEEQSYQ